MELGTIVNLDVNSFEFVYFIKWESLHLKILTCAANHLPILCNALRSWRIRTACPSSGHAIGRSSYASSRTLLTMTLSNLVSEPMGLRLYAALALQLSNVRSITSLSLQLSIPSITCPFSLALSLFAPNPTSFNPFKTSLCFLIFSSSSRISSSCSAKVLSISGSSFT